MLVIARKFNDIYYAMSLPLWKDSKWKMLCIIANGVDPNSFPCQTEFDRVESFYYRDDANVINILKLVKQIGERIKGVKINTVVLSNPVLVVNQFLIKRVHAQKILLVEDGSLNYGFFSPSKNFLKRVLQILLGINQNRLFRKITETYLFHPEKANYFYGEKRLLKLNKEIYNVPSDLLSLEGKKIFVGQPLYSYNYMSMDDYSKLVNKIIQLEGIEYYLPHAFSSNFENIECTKLSLADYNQTLESLSSCVNLTLYSFGSTVLYSCKTINPKTQSILVRTKDASKLNYDVSFVKKFCDRELYI